MERVRVQVTSYRKNSLGVCLDLKDEVIRIHYLVTSTYQETEA